MKESPSNRRLAENEVIFRKANEKVQKELHDLRQMARSEGFDDLYAGKDTPLHFYCECADEKCDKRIVCTPAKYKQLHRSKTSFIVLPGHEVPTIERVILREKDFLVVDKFMTPPDKTDGLHPTNLDNDEKKI